MDNNNKHIISELYFIRATLSKISTAFEKIDESRSAKTVEDRNARLSKVKEELSSAKEHLDDVEAKIIELEKKYPPFRRRIIENNESTVPKVEWSMIITHIFIPLVISSLLCIWWINSGFRFGVGLLFFPIAIITLFMVWFTCSWNSKAERMARKQKYCKMAEEIRQTEEELKRKKQSLEDQIVNRNNDILMLEKEIVWEKERIEKNSKKVIASCTSEITALYNSIQNAIIDKRDYEHLDIIIYELETGRAENIKEALQQADLLVRHNEIIDAINQASRAVCLSIEENISEISCSIERNMARIHDDFVSLDEDQRRIQNSLADLVSAQELSNALQEKANVSSAELAEDLRRIRELKDYEYYGHMR